MILRTANRAAWWAGRLVGAVEQLRDALAVATLPIVLPNMSWETSIRLAVRGLVRGTDLSSLANLGKMAAKVGARNALAEIAKKNGDDNDARWREKGRADA